MICIGNRSICNGIWVKYYKWCYTNCGYTYFQEPLMSELGLGQFKKKFELCLCQKSRMKSFMFKAITFFIRLFEKLEIPKYI